MDLIELRNTYPSGIRIRITQNVEDKYSPIPAGTEGTVNFIDDAGQLHGTWSSLALVPDIDQFEKVSIKTPQGHFFIKDGTADEAHKQGFNYDRTTKDIYGLSYDVYTNPQTKESFAFYDFKKASNMVVDAYELLYNSSDATKDCAGIIESCKDRPDLFFWKNSNDLGNIDIEQDHIFLRVLNKIKIDDNLYVYEVEDVSGEKPEASEDNELITTREQAIQNIKDCYPKKLLENYCVFHMIRTHQEFNTPRISDLRVNPDLSNPASREKFNELVSFVYSVGEKSFDITTFSKIKDGKQYYETKAQELHVDRFSNYVNRGYYDKAFTINNLSPEDQYCDEVQFAKLLTSIREKVETRENYQTVGAGQIKIDAVDISYSDIFKLENGYYKLKGEISSHLGKEQYIDGFGLYLDPKTKDIVIKDTATEFDAEERTIFAKLTDTVNFNFKNIPFKKAIDTVVMNGITLIIPPQKNENSK